MNWIRHRSLTLVLLALFVLFTAGQVYAGWLEYNTMRAEHGSGALSLVAYLWTGHFWEALLENWESEFLQMAGFVILTTVLVQKGSPESRRPNVVEPYDADPRRFVNEPGVPWPVRRGGLVLRLYENSLGVAFLLLFLFSWIGHAMGGFAEHREDALVHGHDPGTFAEFVVSPAFWFQSFQNWQSEFLAIAAMVWLSVYLRQRYSPESKPVHAPHAEND